MQHSIHTVAQLFPTSSYFKSDYQEQEHNREVGKWKSCIEYWDQERQG